VRVLESHVAAVVAEASSGADDPGHVAAVVGAFLQRQPMVGHYVQGHLAELGPQGTVLLLLHAALLGRVLELAAGRTLPPVGPTQLDLACSAPLVDEQTFASAQTELASYLASNLTDEDPTLGGGRRELSLRLLRIIVIALLDALDTPARRR
jgi:hypothetical protein